MTPQAFAELKAAFRADMEAIGCFHFDDSRHGAPLTVPPSDPVRDHQRWTPEDDAELRSLWEARAGAVKMARALLRTPRAVMARIVALDLRRSRA